PLCFSVVNPRGYGCCAHQCRHISRSAAWKRRANVGPSQRGEASTRARRDDRSEARRAASRARDAAISTYRSSLPAISSGRPTLLRRLLPTRAALMRPARETTGTPMYSASQIVVVPLYGNESSITSTRSYAGSRLLVGLGVGGSRMR